MMQKAGEKREKVLKTCVWAYEGTINQIS